MSLSFTASDGCRLAYDDAGTGVPVLWQHGLGADRNQPAEVFPHIPDARRITLECRGHGQSELGDTHALSIAQFAGDALELLDHLRIERAIVGGISLGAALALRLAALAPDRVGALILARPAWVELPAPSTMRPFLLVGRLLAESGRDEGLLRFQGSPLFRQVKAVSPDNVASLQSFFSAGREDATIALLSRIALDGPGVDASQISAIAVPALVIATGDEYVHPLRYAAHLHDLVPGSQLQVICSKTRDAALYRSQFRSALAAFLNSHLELA